MKKVIYSIFLLLTLISCLKESVENKESYTLLNSTESNLTGKKVPYLDSIYRMNKGMFLNSIITSRELDSIKKIDTEVLNTKSSTTTYEGEEYTDISGLMHFRIFWAQSQNEISHPSAEAVVGEGYVLVGGGAEATDLNYLYESRPDELLTKWIARSKDHIIPDAHYITAYAIGMKIDGVTPEYLRSKMQVFSSTSIQPLNHTDWTVTIPTNYLLIGGGVSVHWNGYGNLLTACYPTSSTQWRVMSKDHRRADPATITAYAIGIENISYPNVGYLQVNAISEWAHCDYYHIPTTPVTIPTGWAMTCSAGRATYYNGGRLLSKMFPFSPTISKIQSTYSYLVDSGENYSWALMIKRGI